MEMDKPDKDDAFLDMEIANKEELIRDGIVSALPAVTMKMWSPRSWRE